MVVRTLRVFAAAVVTLFFIAFLLDATSQFDGEQQVTERGQAGPVRTGWVQVDRASFVSDDVDDFGPVRMFEGHKCGRLHFS